MAEEHLYKVSIHYRSGLVLNVTCEGCEVDKDGTTVKRISFNGIKDKQLLFFSLEEIDCIVCEELY